MADREHYIVEFHQVGNVMKVSAIDPATMVEVSIVGPVNAGEETLRRNAVRKLQYVLDKRGSGSGLRPGMVV